MRLAAIVMCCLVFCATVPAQQIAPSSSGDQPLSPTMHGAFAMTFPFNGFSLASFSTGVGIKYWNADKTALTATLTLTSNSNDNTYLKQAIPTYTSSTTSSTMTAGLDAAYLWHIHATLAISPYAGVGAGIAYGKTKNTSTNNAGATTDNTSHTMTVGGNVVLGVEYFFTRNISLAGQHMLGVSSQTTTVDAGTNFPNGTGTTLGIGTSSLILAIYW